MVHSKDVLDIRLKKENTYEIVNLKTGFKTDSFFTKNLTNLVNTIVQPTSMLHKNIFQCDCSDEVNNIRKEFYV